MDDYIFFTVVLEHADYADGHVEFIVKAEYAKQALVYVEATKGGRVLSVIPTEYFDCIHVPRHYLEPECTGHADKH